MAGAEGELGARANHRGNGLLAHALGCRASNYMRPSDAPLLRRPVSSLSTKLYRFLHLHLTAYNKEESNGRTSGSNTCRFKTYCALGVDQPREGGHDPGAQGIFDMDNSTTPLPVPIDRLVQRAGVEPNAHRLLLHHARPDLRRVARAIHGHFQLARALLVGATGVLPGQLDKARLTSSNITDISLSAAAESNNFTIAKLRAAAQSSPNLSP